MIQRSRQDDVTIIELDADYESLDETALDELGGLLLTEAATVTPPQLVLDLSQTQYVGSMFIELLVRAWKRLTERGGSLALCGVQPFCAEVLRITQLDTLWESFPSQQEAVAAMRARPQADGRR